jgi:hypothetical protein
MLKKIQNGETAKGKESRRRKIGQGTGAATASGVKEHQESSALIEEAQGFHFLK